MDFHYNIFFFLAPQWRRDGVRGGGGLFRDLKGGICPSLESLKFLQLFFHQICVERGKNEFHLSWTTFLFPLGARVWGLGPRAWRSVKRGRGKRGAHHWK